MGAKVASRRDSRLAMRDLERNKVNDLNSRSGVLKALWLDSEGTAVSHSRPRSKVADLDSRSGVLTASWLDSEGVD